MSLKLPDSVKPRKPRAALGKTVDQRCYAIADRGVGGGCGGNRGSNTFSFFPPPSFGSLQMVGTPPYGTLGESVYCLCLEPAMHQNVITFQ